MKFRKLGIALITCLLCASFLFSGTAYAKDEALPDPGMTPDSPFYFLDTWGKNIGMSLAFGPEAKARKALQYAEERLAEARAMATDNRVREMTRAANDYDGFMAMVATRAEEARRLGASDNISERVALATAKHLSVLDRIKDQVPDQAKEAIVRAREASMNGQINALRALAENRPEKALDISAETIKDRLERARARATDNVTADVAEALDDADRLAEIEDEMVAIAQKKGVDVTAIEERLARSTSNRLEVLGRVYEKVPEQARPAIANALENSLVKYDRVIERLSGDNITGEMQVLERAREELKERIRLITAAGAASDNTSSQNRIREEVKERVREQVANSKPETPGPAAPGNRNK